MGFAIHWVQKALISAYEDKCPLRLVKTGRQSLKWTLELESLRRGVRRLFNKCQSDKNPHSWALYRQALQKYWQEVRKASKNAWRTFCSSINDLPSSARLHRTLSRDPKIKVGSLVAPCSRHMQFEGETLELLLTTHFPNSRVTQELPDPVAALLAKCSSWRLAVVVVTYRRVEWVIDYFAPYKYPGMDGIFPAFVAKGTGGCCPIPGQNILCLPVHWLCSSHMVTG